MKTGREKLEYFVWGPNVLELVHLRGNRKSDQGIIPIKKSWLKKAAEVLKYQIFNSRSVTWNE